MLQHFRDRCFKQSTSFSGLSEIMNLGLFYCVSTDLFGFYILSESSHRIVDFKNGSEV